MASTRSVRLCSVLQGPPLGLGPKGSQEPADVDDLLPFLIHAGPPPSAACQGSGYRVGSPGPSDRALQARPTRPCAPPGRTSDRSGCPAAKSRPIRSTNVDSRPLTTRGIGRSNCSKSPRGLTANRIQHGTPRESRSGRRLHPVLVRVAAMWCRLLPGCRVGAMGGAVSAHECY
jgi:hypothetical protein